MKLKLLITFLIVSLLLLTITGVSGDTIVLKEGKEIQCTILSMNQSEVRIDASGVEMCIPRSRVKEIKKTEISPPVSESLTPTPSPTLSLPGSPPAVQPTGAPPLSGLPSLASITSPSPEEQQPVPEGLAPFSSQPASPQPESSAPPKSLSSPSEQSGLNLPSLLSVPGQQPSQPPQTEQALAPLTTIQQSPPPGTIEHPPANVPSSPMILKPLQPQSPTSVEEKAYQESLKADTSPTPIETGSQPPVLSSLSPFTMQTSPETSGTPIPVPTQMGLQPFSSSREAQGTQEFALKPFSGEKKAEKQLEVASLPSITQLAESPQQTTEKPIASPDREFRALWISRFEWPTSDPAECQNNIRTMFETVARANFNAVIFQVRGQGDVLYRSEMEPWSSRIGGKDPGFDPLQFAIEEAHKRGLELHAWVNPYPVWQGTTLPSPSEPLHPVLKYCSPTANPNWLCYDKWGNPMKADENFDKYLYFSPGIPEVQDYIRKVVIDIVKRYDVDGIHYDRVRYPGPDFSHDPISQQRFSGDGNPDKLSWEDWQRRQITDCLERIYAEIMLYKPQIKVTAAVWGIYNKFDIPGYDRFSSGYHDYYQDSIQWAEVGAVDALIPMIYWAMNDGKKPDYDDLIKYFSEKVKNRHLYGGLYAWSEFKQIQEAIEFTRQVNAQGNVIFSWGELLGNDYFSKLSSTVYSNKVETPEMPWKTNPTTGIILGKVVRESDGSPVVDALVDVAEIGKHCLSSADGTFAFLELPPGNLTLSALKNGIGESTVQATVEPGHVTQIEIKL